MVPVMVVVFDELADRLLQLPLEPLRLAFQFSDTLVPARLNITPQRRHSGRASCQSLYCERRLFYLSAKVISTRAVGPAKVLLLKLASFAKVLLLKSTETGK